MNSYGIETSKDEIFTIEQLLVALIPTDNQVLTLIDARRRLFDRIDRCILEMIF